MTTISESTRYRYGRLGARFLGDQQGVAAVEFMLIVPMMFVLMFGTVQFTSGFAALRKVTLVAHTMSDLISQATEVGGCDLDNALKVGNAIMSPYSSAAMSATISEVYIDPNTHTSTIVWSQGSKKYTIGDVVTVPAGIALGGKYLIMSEVNYDYRPLIGFDGASKFTSAIFHMQRVSFTGPRQSIKVEWNPAAAACS